MKIKKYLTASTPVRRAKLALLVAGLLTASALVTSPASAVDTKSTGRAAQLAKADNAVGDSGVSGVAWYINKASGKVSVTVDSTVSVEEISKIKKYAGPQAGLLEIKRIEGKFSLAASGGDRISGPPGSNICSLGFNVRRGNTFYGLTAGHCGSNGTTWYTGAQVPLGTMWVSMLGINGADYGLIQHALPSATADGNVNLYNGSYRDITSSGTPYVGQRVETSGMTTGYGTGTVRSIDTSLSVGGYQFTNMIVTDACRLPGDSGGPLFSRNTAYGVLSSSTAQSCGSSGGGFSIYEPITRALGAYSLSVF
ncbi:S1 family peptidase [Streptomyces jumonjinensis]|uniref:S1 family peptidase n=1 Tax=Streptomyces jumonjinensis TaxID=1945 RepID=A0A646KLI1_STRJU|nr:S1 family peptidase [Streptomyces jumonjinensis]MQT02801.1 S1 family peptidase [Streptomyces jumonjinensis]